MSGPVVTIDNIEKLRATPGKELQELIKSGGKVIVKGFNSLGRWRW